MLAQLPDGPLTPRLIASRMTPASWRNEFIKSTTVARQKEKHFTYPQGMNANRLEPSVHSILKASLRESIHSVSIPLTIVERHSVDETS